MYQPSDKKFYLLSGSYGTGKSHLCLMTANFLSRSSGDPEIAGFYANYAGLDAETARMLKNIRKDGQYLVAICDYYSGKRFEDVVLKAVLEACAVRGLAADVTTEFDEAERQLSQWEEKGAQGGIRNFYQDFVSALGQAAPGRSEEPQVVDPLAPDRSPEATTLDIKEGQRGISYARLFAPYLKGATLVKVCDPYVRLQYQIYNFMSFCEILEPPADGMKVELMTGVDAYQEAELKRKLEELKSGLQQDQIELEYHFDNSLHDRWIETDTGWRMMLGRGLDIFQKAEDRFTLGFFDQTKRKCKATTITYVKKE